MSRSLHRDSGLDRLTQANGHRTAEDAVVALPGNDHAIAGSGAQEAPPRTSAEALCRLVRDLASADPRIIALGFRSDEAFARFAKQLPDRFFAADAADPAAWEWCFGLAASGSRPVVFVEAATLAVVQQEIVREIRSNALAVTIVVHPPESPSVHIGEARSASLNGDLARLASVSLMAPSSVSELSSMLTSATAGEGTSMIWLPRSLDLCATPMASEADATRWGQSQRIGAGDDVALVAIGDGVEAARQAARLLAAEGIAATILNLRFLRPLDDEAILSTARRARALVLLEENPNLGLAGEVLNVLSLRGITRPMSVLMPPSRSRHRSRYDANHPYVRQIVECCRALSEDSSPGSEADQLREARVADIRDLADFLPTSEQVQRELEAVLALELTPTMQEWVDAYEKLGRRSLYLWKWCQQGIELTILPCVPAEWRAHVNDTKLLGVMLDVLLDDVADFERDSVFLERLIGLLNNQTSLSEFAPEQLAYAEFTKRVWDAINQRAREYPNFAAYEDLFRYDYLQLINTMRYSNLVNRRLALLNLVEHDLYLPHNMHMIIFSTLDLMCIPHVHPRELGHVREAMWHAQCMGQIGNQITTWQRELDEGDYTSGVFARAITMGDLTVDQLVDGNRDQIETAIRRGRHEEHFFQQWKNHRHRLIGLTGRISAFDVSTLVGGLDRLTQIELGSRGQR